MKDKILDIIECQVGQKVDADTLIDSLAIDSLEFLDLLLSIEEETGVQIPTTSIGKLHTVGDILSRVG